MENRCKLIQVTDDVNWYEKPNISRKFRQLSSHIRKRRTKGAWKGGSETKIRCGSTIIQRGSSHSVANETLTKLLNHTSVKYTLNYSLLLISELIQYAIRTIKYSLVVNSAYEVSNHRKPLSMYIITLSMIQQRIIIVNYFWIA